MLVHVLHEGLEDGLHGLGVLGGALLVDGTPLAPHSLSSLGLQEVALLVVEHPASKNISNEVCGNVGTRLESILLQCTNIS